MRFMGCGAGGSGATPDRPTSRSWREGYERSIISSTMLRLGIRPWALSIDAVA